MRHWENIHYQMSEGLMSDEQWHGFRKNLEILFGVTAYQDYWKHESELYSESFRREVDAVIQDSEGHESRARIANRFRKQ